MKNKEEDQRQGISSDGWYGAKAKTKDKQSDVKYGARTKAKDRWSN